MGWGKKMKMNQTYSRDAPPQCRRSSWKYWQRFKARHLHQPQQGFLIRMQANGLGQISVTGGITGHQLAQNGSTAKEYKS